MTKSGGRMTIAKGCSASRANFESAIVLASQLGRPYMRGVALLFESGPYFVSLQASNPVPYPIAAVRLATRRRVVEIRQWSSECLTVQ